MFYIYQRQQNDYSIINLDVEQWGRTEECSGGCALTCNFGCREQSAQEQPAKNSESTKRKSLL